MRTLLILAALGLGCAGGGAAYAHWYKSDCDCEDECSDEIADVSDEIAETAVLEAFAELEGDLKECAVHETPDARLACYDETIRASY